MKMKKKAVLILLALTLVFAMIPLMTGPAYAAAEDTVYELSDEFLPGNNYIIAASNTGDAPVLIADGAQVATTKVKVENGKICNPKLTRVFSAIGEGTEVNNLRNGKKYMIGRTVTFALQPVVELALINEPSTDGSWIYNEGILKYTGGGKNYYMNYDGRTLYVTTSQEEATKVYLFKEVKYDLWVGGVQVTSSNKGNVLAGDPVNDGKVSFTPAEGETPATLTLNGANIKTGYNSDLLNVGIYYTGSEELQIDLADENAVGYKGGPLTHGIYSRNNGDVTITGKGSLAVRASETAIRSYDGSVTINGGTVTLEEGLEGIFAGDVTISDGDVTAYGARGIQADSVTISGGAVIAMGGEYGITSKGVVTISGGTVSASGYENKAISGTVKNSIVGTGWTNTEGTAGEMVITESEAGQDISSFKKVEFPKGEAYPLWVGDTQVTRENAANITGSDPVQASYDADSNTLTLNNYTYEGFGVDNDYSLDTDKAAIQATMDEELTINLNGENTLKHLYKDDSMGAGILVTENLKVTGDGTLTVSDGDRDGDFDSRGIRVKGQELTIESGATVNAASGRGQNSYGVNVNNLTVEGELNAAGGGANNSYGAYASNNVTVSEDGALNATGGTATKDSYGVFIYNKSPSMTIEGAMTAKGNTFAIAKAADPNPGINTAAIQYTVPADYVVTQSENYDGSGATSVAAGETTSENAKYVRIIGSAPVTGVSLNKTSTTLAVGDSETLTAVLKPEYALHPDLVWESNDPSVATVSENGKVTAVVAGSATITVTATNGTEDTSDDKTATCDVTVKPMVKVTVPTGKTFTYNGKTQTGVAAGTGYSLTGATAANAGTYTAKATLNASTDCIYKWSDGTTAPKTIKWTINKAANPLKIKAKTATVKFSTVKKKNQKLAVTKAIKFTNKGQGAKSYAKVSGNKKIAIAKKTGKVTVKKGLKKGTYKVKVKVKAAGNTNYKPSAWKVVTFKIKIK